LSAGLEAHPEAVAAVGARRAWFMTEGYSRRDSHPHVPRLRDIVDDLLVDWSAVSGQNLYRTELVRRIGGFDGKRTRQDQRQAQCWQCQAVDRGHRIFQARSYSGSLMGWSVFVSV